MKIKLLIFFTLLISYTNAQTEKEKNQLEWSNIDKENPIEFRDLTVLTDGKILGYSKNNRSFSLTLLDENYKFSKTKIFKFKDLCKKCFFPSFIELDGDFYVQLEPTAGKKKADFKILKLDIESFEFSDTDITFFNPKLSDPTIGFSQGGIDQKYYLKGFIKGKEKKIIIKAYGKGMVELYDRSTSIPHESFELISSRIDDAGTSYVLIAFKEEDKEGNPISFKLFVASPGKNSIERFSLTSKQGTLLSYLDMAPMKNGDGVFFSGQYFDKEVLSNNSKNNIAFNVHNLVERLHVPTAGKINFTFDLTNGFSEKQYYKFTKNVLNPSYLKKNRKKKSNTGDDNILMGIPELQVNDILFLKNGDIAELSEVYIEANKTIEGRVIYTDSHTFRGKIVLTLMSSDGLVKWIKSIDRIHEISRDPSKSKLVSIGDDLVVSYIDGNASYLNIFKLNSEEVTVKPFRKGFFLWPFTLNVLNEKTVLIAGRKNETIKFGKLTLN